MNGMFDESYREAWRQRFGREPEHEAPALARFLAHRSIRRFKPDRLNRETIQALVAAAQSSATSSNLQLWSVVTVQDQIRRDRMADICGDQIHVSEAGAFFAFLADHHRIRRAAKARGENAEGLEYTEFYTMAVIDAALAAERMVCAAETLGLGICYIGGLRNEPYAVKELLQLPAGVFGVFGLCVGWPAEPVVAEIKPRLAQEAVWFEETYNPQPDTDEYDVRMEPFYKEQGMKGEATWSMRSGRRVGLTRMTGRETQLEFLHEQGFLRK